MTTSIATPFAEDKGPDGDGAVRPPARTSAVTISRLRAKHTPMTRLTHWVNFPVLFLMIWSGLLIYWANDVYRIGIGSWTLFHFFPDWIYNSFALHHRLAEGMSVHFLLMWFFALNGLLYVTFTILSGEWRELLPNLRSPREAIAVTMHDLRLRKTLPPQGKYNGAQKIAYTAIVLMGFGSLLTGIAIYRPTQVAWLTSLLGGYRTARLVHFWLTMGYSVFFLIHIAQVIRAGWNNFRPIVTGADLTSEGERLHSE